MLDIIRNHEKAALQVSGGRDSLACFWLLKNAGLLDHVTVYWVNSGNAFPELLAIMAHIKELSPHFVEIAGRHHAVIEEWGIPTDILPRSCTPIGRLANQSAVKMQDSYSCCGRVIMQPLHERMIADGVTLIIRGQRGDDGHKAPILSGEWENGIQYLFPIEDWSREQVNTYLQEQGAPRNPCYDYVNSTPDCMNCSGWWEDGRSGYLKAHYPAAYQRYQHNLDIIREECDRLIYLFNGELNG